MNEYSRLDHLVDQVYVLGIVAGEYCVSVLLFQKVVWRNKAIKVEDEDEHWVSEPVHYSGSWLMRRCSVSGVVRQVTQRQGLD